MTNEMKIQELQFPVPWGHVAAKAWGSPENSPILLVHGLMDNAGSYSRLISLLPKNFYYVCIDLPGHGFSSHFPAGIPLDFFNYVLCIELVIRALGWKNFIYVGHSLGGLIGYLYIALYPEKVSRMIIIDGGIPFDYSEDQLLSRIREVQKNALDNYQDINERLLSYDEVIYALKYKRMNCLNTEAAEALFERSITKVGNLYRYNRDPRLKIMLRPLFSYDQYLEFFKRVRLPSLIIFSSANFFRYSTLMELETDLLSALKVSEIIIIEGNHDVHNNHPERVSPVIRKFLNFINSSKL